MDGGLTYRLVEMLESLQWADDRDYGEYCPKCGVGSAGYQGRLKPREHEPDCALAMLIDEAKRAG